MQSHADSIHERVISDKETREKWNSIDATSVSGGAVLGRLVNHSRRPTAKMKVLCVDGIPHLCLFSICDMVAGQQV